MRLPLPVLLLGCASLTLACSAPAARAGGPTACNAKHKRPANLYGSVLSDGLKPVVAPSTAKGAAATSDPAPRITTDAAAAPKPAQVSQAQIRASFAPCAGGQA